MTSIPSCNQSALGSWFAIAFLLGCGGGHNTPPVKQGASTTAESESSSKRQWNSEGIVATSEEMLVLQEAHPAFAEWRLAHRPKALEAGDDSVFVMGDGAGIFGWDEQGKLFMAAPATGIGALAVGAGHVYWAPVIGDDPNLYRTPRKGGQRHVVVSGDAWKNTAFLLRLSQSALYLVTEYEGVWKVPRTGGQPTLVHKVESKVDHGHQATASAFVTIGETLYFADRDGAVWTMAQGRPEKITTLAGDVPADNMATDGRNVYVADEFAVTRIDAQRKPSKVGDRAVAIAGAAGVVCWATREKKATYRIVCTTGQGPKLVTTVPDVADLAVAGGFVYWIQGRGVTVDGADVHRKRI